VLLRLLVLARGPVELAKAEVAVGDEGVHAEFIGEGQRPPVGTFSVRGAGGRRNVASEAQGVGLASTSAGPAGDHEGLPNVAGGLIGPFGRQAGRRRAEKGDRPPSEPMTKGPATLHHPTCAGVSEIVPAEFRDLRPTEDGLPGSREAVPVATRPARASWSAVRQRTSDIAAITKARSSRIIACLLRASHLLWKSNKHLLETAGLPRGEAYPL